MECQKIMKYVHHIQKEIFSNILFVPPTVIYCHYCHFNDNQITELFHYKSTHKTEKWTVWLVNDYWVISNAFSYK